MILRVCFSLRRIRPFACMKIFSTLFMAMVLSSSACSRPISEATGVVMYGEREVICGTVVFVGPDGMTKTARIDPLDSRYLVEDVGAGEVLVAIVSEDPALPQNASRPAKGDDPDRINWMEPRADRTKWFPLPLKFERVQTSGLKVWLEPGKNSGINIRIPESIEEGASVSFPPSQTDS